MHHACGGGLPSSGLNLKAIDFDPVGNEGMA